MIDWKQSNTKKTEVVSMHEHRALYFFLIPGSAKQDVKISCEILTALVWLCFSVRPSLCRSVLPQKLYPSILISVLPPKLIDVVCYHSQ